MTRTVSGALARRDFLASCALGATVPALAAPAAEGEWRNKQAGMTYRRPGPHGPDGFSHGQWAGDDIRPDNIEQVLWSVDQGLNYFDTAPQYGRGLSEKGYAEVIKARGRDKIFMADKVNVFPNRTFACQRIFSTLSEEEQASMRARVDAEIKARDIENPGYIGNYFAGQSTLLRQTALANVVAEKYGDRIEKPKTYTEYVMKSVENSLTALGTDYLDILLLRGVETPQEIQSTPEVFEPVEQLKKQGKIRFVGISSHSDPAGVLAAALDCGKFDMAMVAYNYLNHKWLDPVIERAGKANVGIMAMKASRFLQNPYNRRQTQPDRVKLLNAAVPGDMTIFQKGFHWVLQNPNVAGAVVGMTDLAQAKENLQIIMNKG